MKLINQTELGELLATVTHAMPIAFSALTLPKVRKTGNPFASIRKLSKVQAFTGADYERSVQRQETREGNQASFVAQARTWGERISPALVSNKGKLYLVAQIQRTRKPVYLTEQNGLLVVTPKEKVAPYLAPVSFSAQPVAKEIVYRNYALENITALSINGEQYRVRR